MGTFTGLLTFGDQQWGFMVEVPNITFATIQKGGSTGGLPASQITRTSANTIPPSPTFTFTRPNTWADGNKLVSQVSSDETFASGVTEVTVTLAAATTSYDLINPDLTSGPKYIRIGAYTGNRPTSLIWSNIIGAGDAATPTITSSAARSVPQNVAGSLLFTANKGGYLQIVGGVDQGIFTTSGQSLQIEAQYTPRDYLVQVQWVSYAGVPSTTMNCTITVADVTAPILSSPVATSGISGTTGSAGVSVDEPSTIYTVITATNTTPSGLQVEAGQDSTGAAAYPQTSVVVSTAGAKVIVLNNGIPSATGYIWYMAKDSSGNRSAVLSGGSATFGAPISTSTWTANGDYVLTNGNKTASLVGTGVGSDIIGTFANSSGTGKKVILTCDFSAGTLLDPGLVDTGTGVKMTWTADGSGAFPYAWNGTNPRHAALTFDCDFTARTVTVSIDGVVKGTVSMPASNFVNVRPYAQLGYSTAPYIILDSTNWG